MEEKTQSFDKELDSFIKDINPQLTDEEVTIKISEIKERLNRKIINGDKSKNPFLLVLLLLCGYTGIMDKAKDALIEFFKDKTGVKATFEDVKLYNDIDSELNTYKTIKEYLENNKPSNETSPILTMILNYKDLFIAPLNDKIKVLFDKQEYILNKYKSK